MDRKIIKVGNSLGVIIPSAFLESLGVDYKDTVELDYNSELKTITIKNKSTAPNDNYLEQVVKDTVDKYLREKGY